MAIVIFDPEEFRETHPQFPASAMTDAVLEYRFSVAVALIGNSDDDSIFPYNPPGQMLRKILLDLIVCHLTEISMWGVGQSGPIASAAEGSVNASFQQMQNMRGPDFFKTTRCGQMFLEFIRPYVVGGRFYWEDTYHPWG